MWCSYRAGRWRSVATIGAAALMAGTMLAGGIGEAFASVDVPNSSPPAPGPKITQVTLTSVDVPIDPGPIGPKTIVIGGSGPGDGPGPKAVFIPETGRPRHNT